MKTQLRTYVQRHDQPRPVRATFIIRAWHEKSGVDPAAWRGTIEHVQSGDRRGAADAHAMLTLLEDWLAALEDGP